MPGALSSTKKSLCIRLNDTGLTAMQTHSSQKRQDNDVQDALTDKHIVKVHFDFKTNAGIYL